MSANTDEFMEMFTQIAAEKPAFALAIALVIHNAVQHPNIGTQESFERDLTLSCADEKVLELVALMRKLPGWNRDNHGRFRKTPTPFQVIREALLICRPAPEFRADIYQASIDHWLTFCEPEGDAS